MRRYIIFVIGILMLFLFTGCKSDNKNIKEPNEEKSVVNQKYLLLKNNNNKTIQKNPITGQNSCMENDEILNLIKKEAKEYRKELASCNPKSNLLNMFNPYNLNEGDKIGNLTVKNIDIKHGYESVKFDGEFEISGRLAFNQVSSDLFVFILDKDNYYKMPYTVRELEWKGKYFDIINGNDVITALGGKYRKTFDFYLDITAVFSNYTYYYLNGSDLASRARFVKLISVKQ